MISYKDTSCLEIMVLVLLSAYSITIVIHQTALAQEKQTSSGNVTAQIVPQGTPLQASNKTTNANPTETTMPSGNVTAQVVPQGTSLNASNTTTTTNIEK